MDMDIHQRAHVALNAWEADIVRQLCETPWYALYKEASIAQPTIPFNGEQRIFKYAEVLHPSHTIPKALNGAEWLKWMGIGQEPPPLIKQSSRVSSSILVSMAG